MSLHLLQTTDPVELLTDVTTTDPTAGPLLAGGLVILSFSVGVVTYLALGAVVDAFERPFE